jgi:hypothetical protein
VLSSQIEIAEPPINLDINRGGFLRWLVGGQECADATSGWLR